MALACREKRGRRRRGSTLSTTRTKNTFGDAPWQKGTSLKCRRVGGGKKFRASVRGGVGGEKKAFRTIARNERGGGRSHNLKKNRGGVEGNLGHHVVQGTHGGEKNSPDRTERGRGEAHAEKVASGAQKRSGLQQRKDVLKKGRVGEDRRTTAIRHVKEERNC